MRRTALVASRLCVLGVLGVLGAAQAAQEGQATARASDPAAPGAAPDATSLAKATQNPVADLISLPFQLNFNTGGGLDADTQLLLNFQPVVPIKLTPSWSVIARAIVPLLDSPTANQNFRGLGDIQSQLYVTPAKPGGLIWGAGPILSFPTATTAIARTGSWAMGPAGVVVKMTGPWVIGALANQLWTYADEGGEPEVELFTAQVFVNYNFGVGWALATSPLITANWDAPDGQEWTVPLGLGLTKTTVWQGQPMSLGVQYYRNVEHPDAAAANQLRFVVSLLFPTKH